MTRKTHTDLVRDLIDAAYESGHYNGGPHHMKAIRRRGRLRRAVLERLKQGDEIADKLRAEIAELGGELTKRYREREASQ